MTQLFFRSPAVMLFLCVVELSPAAQERYEVIIPASKRELLPVAMRIQSDERFKDDDLDYLPEQEGYILDINNDGKLEYVFIHYTGSINCINFNIFTEKNNKLERLELPDSLNFYHAFYNPIEKRQELFVKVQGKIYICSGDGTREIYAWEQGNCSKVCNKFWITEQRNLFNELYKSKQYGDAFKFLNNFEIEYRKEIESQIDLWIRNDSVLAALRDSRFTTALGIIDTIKADPAFVHASPSLQKAVATNEKLAQEESAVDKKKGSQGYDYSWLLEYKDKSQNYAMWDARMNSLMAAAVPDLMVPEYSDTYWRDDIVRHFGGPGKQDTVTLVDNRYVVFSGFYPHSAMNRGFFWCDLQDKISAIAIGESDKSDAVLYITSRSLTSDAIPQEFCQALAHWIEDEEITSMRTEFYDRLGNKYSIPIQVFKDENLESDV